MRSKPVAEGSHQRWIDRHILKWFSRADPTPDELSMEKLHSKRRVITDLSSLEMRASTSAKMATEGIKRVAIDVRQNTASSLNEAAEMGGGSNVSNGAGGRVSIAFQVICERVDVWPGDSATQAPQRFGRRKVLF
jgi:hypothetical protein